MVASGNHLTSVEKLLKLDSLWKDLLDVGLAFDAFQIQAR